MVPQSTYGGSPQTRGGIEPALVLNVEQDRLIDRSDWSEICDTVLMSPPVDIIASATTQDAPLGSHDHQTLAAAFHLSHRREVYIAACPLARLTISASLTGRLRGPAIPGAL